MRRGPGCEEAPAVAATGAQPSGRQGHRLAPGLRVRYRLVDPFGDWRVTPDMTVVVAPFSRWPGFGSVVDVATILDAPGKPSGGALPPPVKCRHCHRPVRSGHLVGGLGSTCARRAGIRAPHARRPREVDHAGPDLLDLLAL